MKIESGSGFKPFNIVIETREEALNIWARLNISLLKKVVVVHLIEMTQ